MAAPKKSVDEIWRELNARPAPRSSIAGIAGLPGLASRTRAVPKPQPEAPAVAELQATLAEESRRRNVTYDPSKAGVTAEEVAAYVATIQRTINCLSDPDRATRRQSVTALHSKLFSGDAATPKASPQLLQARMAASFNS